MTDAVESWAEQVEAAQVERKEEVRGNLKTVTEYMTNDKGDRIQIVSEYKIERKTVPRRVAERKKWPKFGACGNDGPGIQSANTLLADDVHIQFVRNRAGDLVELVDADDPMAKLKSKGIMSCKLCKANDHFTVQCPYKGMLDDLEGTFGAPAGTEPSSNTMQQEMEDKAREGKYITPAMKAKAAGVAMPSMNDRRDENTIRLSNLPEDTTDSDLRDLCEQMGHVVRLFLAKDKVRNTAKDYAFVTYESRERAAKAIQTLNGHKYSHLILKAEWAKPTAT